MWGRWSAVLPHGILFTLLVSTWPSCERCMQLSSSICAQIPSYKPNIIAKHCDLRQSSQSKQAQQTNNAPHSSSQASLTSYHRPELPAALKRSANTAAHVTLVLAIKVAVTQSGDHDCELTGSTSRLLLSKSATSDSRLLSLHTRSYQKQKTVHIRHWLQCCAEKSCSAQN